MARRPAVSGNEAENFVEFEQCRVGGREVGRVLADFGPGPGHVFNLGHGIVPQTPPENVAALVEAVRATSPRYHEAPRNAGR